jgi:hypothetical protein
MKDDPKIWRQFGVTKRRLARFLTVLAANAANAINNLGAEPCHGMEEVVGSIPTRSTNSPRYPKIEHDGFLYFRVLLVRPRGDAHLLSCASIFCRISRLSGTVVPLRPGRIMTIMTIT